MDESRSDWYVRHSGPTSQIRVDPESSAADLPLFEQYASFILRTDSFYQGHYALESMSLFDHYIRQRDDGELWIEPDAYTRAYIDAASFTFYQHDSSREYCNTAVYIISSVFNRQQRPGWTFVTSIFYDLGMSAFVFLFSPGKCILCLCLFICFFVLWLFRSK